MFHLASQVYLHVVISMCYFDLQTIKTKILHIRHVFFHHYCTMSQKNKLGLLWFLESHFPTKQTWIVLKMERVFNILVFFVDVLSCKWSNYFHYDKNRCYKRKRRERLLKEIIEQWNIFIFVWQVWRKVTNEELGGFYYNYEQLNF